MLVYVDVYIYNLLCVLITQIWKKKKNPDMYIENSDSEDRIHDFKHAKKDL